MATRLTHVCVVTHTHWDREWYHTAEHFRQRLVRLVDELLDAPPEEPGSFLLDGQAIVLEDYLAVRPERAGELSHLLRAGVLEAGPWYVLADNLIPSGEALVRNLLIGRHTVRRLRGEPPPVLYCPDSFGHPAALPDLAAGFGYSLVLMWRGLGGRRAPSTDIMRWRGPAGGSALIYHLPPDGYEFGGSLPSNDEAALERWKHITEVMTPRSRTAVAILLNGADHHARQLENAEALTALASVAAPIRVRASSLATAARLVVESAEDVDLDELSGELRDSYGYTWTLQGTLGTRAFQKRHNAIAERALLRDVEPWIALMSDGGDSAARALLDASWRTLLQGHPHDTLCGTSIDAVARALDARLSVVQEEACALRSTALERLLDHDVERARVSFSEWQPALVLRNRVARPRAGVAELTLRATVAVIAVGPGSGGKQGARQQPSPWAVDGLSLQILSEAERVELTESPRAYPRADLILEAQALGWLDDATRGYEVRTLAHAPGFAARVPNPIIAGETTLSNGLIRVDVAVDGSITFTDVVRGRRIDDVLTLERRRDVGDLYTPALREPLPAGRIGRVSLVHRGPLRGAIEIVVDPSGNDHSIGALTIAIELDANSSFVRIRVNGDNQSRDQRTRLRINTSLEGAATLADAAFHPVTRVAVGIDAADEAIEHVVPTAPLHRWVARLAADVTAVIVSDGLAEYESTADGAIGITLVRSVGELSRCDLPERPGHAGWPAPTPAAQCFGPFEASFALQLFGPDSAHVREEIERFAEDVLLPLTGETLRSNLGLSRAAGGLELAGAGLAFSAAMPARIAGWIVLRCVNRRDIPVHGTWTLGVAVHEAVMARLDETPTEPVPCADGVISFTAAPRAIVTVLVRVRSIPP